MNGGTYRAKALVNPKDMIRAREEELPWEHVVLSVVVPAYNEVRTIETLLRRVREVPLHLEVIVVDDGSNDGTRDLLPRLEREGLIDQLVFHEVNQGKGSALRTGFRGATGDIVVVQDADMEYDPLELPHLMEPILRERADAVYGSRFLGGAHRVLFFWHSVGNRVLMMEHAIYSIISPEDAAGLIYQDEGRADEVAESLRLIR